MLVLKRYFNLWHPLAYLSQQHLRQLRFHFFFFKFLLHVFSLTLHQWVGCEDSTLKAIYTNWEKNTTAWPIDRPNDYAIVTIGGGSGIGKTTTGRQLKTILFEKYGPTFGLQGKVPPGANVAVVNVFLHSEAMPFLSYPEGFSAEKKVVIMFWFCLILGYINVLFSHHETLNM